jgi:hypothetical protein
MISTALVIGTVDCTFDPSGAPCRPAEPFTGCFGGEPDGVTLQLAQPRGAGFCDSLLEGGLVISSGSSPQIYSLAGHASSDTRADLRGTLAGSNGDDVAIVLLLSVDETMVVGIAGDPPLGPLARCQ